MFDIIETPRNYFIHKLLRDNLSSNVALLFNVKSLAAIFGGSKEVFCWHSTAPVS